MLRFLANPRFQIIAVVMLLAAGGSYLWWTESYEPIQEDIAQLKQREADLRAKNQKVRQQVADLEVEKVERAIEGYEAQSEQVARLVPPDSVDIALLPLITRKAEELGIELLSVDPLTPRSVRTFRAHGASVRARATYHEMGTFLTDILTLENITQVRNVSLRAVDADGSGPTTVAEGERLNREVVATFEFLYFQFRDGGAAAASGGASSDTTTTSPGGSGGAGDASGSNKEAV